MLTNPTTLVKGQIPPEILLTQIYTRSRRKFEYFYSYVLKLVFFK